MLEATAEVVLTVATEVVLTCVASVVALSSLVVVTVVAALASIELVSLLDAKDAVPVEIAVVLLDDTIECDAVVPACESDVPVA
mmetsp:Transcript_60652/g.112508  ORF Transcript_60652/g.112508 Transcript_60652/m.112508 type:complete len:84 (+) Transcript_60652:405-656(+)